MNPTLAEAVHTVSPAIPLLLIVVPGIVVLYCIRKKLVPQLLFLILFALAALAFLSGLRQGSSLLAVGGLVVALASVAGFTWANTRGRAAAG